MDSQEEGRWLEDGDLGPTDNSEQGQLLAPPTPP